MCAKYFNRLLGNVAATAALVLAAGVVQAAEVIVENGKVLRITDLTVVLQGEDAAIYTVDFLDSTGADVWGPNDEDLDFRNEDNVSSALLAVVNTLNEQVPIPSGAGPSGGSLFWIAAEYDDGFYGVVGGQRIGGLWDQCQQSGGCIASVKVPPLLETQQVVIADFTLTTSEPTSTAISASNLPTSRSVQAGAVASAFATIFNGGDRLAEECGISVKSPAGLQGIFNFQEVNEFNLPIGQPNANTDIVNKDFQGYVFWFETADPIDPVTVQLNYDCANTEPAPITVGVNTFLLSASIDPVPDMVSIVSTPSNDGIVDLPGATGSNAMAVAASNAGAEGPITASGNCGSLPMLITVCETDPLTAICINPVVPDFQTTAVIPTFGAPTFSYFMTAFGDIPLDAANNRCGIEFKDEDGVIRGSAGAAVRTE